MIQSVAFLPIMETERLLVLGIAVLAVLESILAVAVAAAALVWSFKLSNIAHDKLQNAVKDESPAAPAVPDAGKTPKPAKPVKPVVNPKKTKKCPGCLALVTLDTPDHEVTSETGSYLVYLCPKCRGEITTAV